MVYSNYDLTGQNIRAGYSRFAMAYSLCLAIPIVNAIGFWCTWILLAINLPSFFLNNIVQLLPIQILMFATASPINLCNFTHGLSHARFFCDSLRHLMLFKKRNLIVKFFSHIFWGCCLSESGTLLPVSIHLNMRRSVYLDDVAYKIQIRTVYFLLSLLSGAMKFSSGSLRALNLLCYSVGWFWLR